MSIPVRIAHWHCPKCGESLNRQLWRRPIRVPLVRCRACGEQSAATRGAVVFSWRMAFQLWGVGAIWLFVVAASLVLPVEDRLGTVIMGAVFGWMLGVFPCMLITTPLGEFVGRRVANRLGL